MKVENLTIELKLAVKNVKISDSLYKKRAISKKKFLDELSKKQKIFTQLEDVRHIMPIIKEEMKEQEKKISSLKADYKKKLLIELGKIQIEIDKLKEKIKADTDRKIRTEIVSPVDGVVKKLYFYTVGGTVRPGDKVAEITPLNDQLVIEAKVRASDRALIWEGQKVAIEITAYDYYKYGRIDGKLVNISPDSVTDKRGNSYYIVKVVADNYKFNEKSPIMTGMVAKIYILSAKRSILYYLLKPLKDIAKHSLTEH